MHDISVTLVSFNTINLTRKALDLLLANTSRVSMQVFVVDNHSHDHSAEILRQEYAGRITLIENNTNVGFGRANNQVIPLLDSRYLLLLNTDAFIEPDTVARTIEYMDSHPQCGILGVKFLDRDGSLQPSCRYFPTPWNNFLNRTGLDRIFRNARMVDDMNWDHATPRNCDWVPGCYFMIRKELIDQIGLFDPRYFLYYEEIDLCFAAKRAGWQVTYFPYTSVIHYGGESAKTSGNITKTGRQLAHLQIESEQLFFRKNYGLFALLHNLLLVTLGDLILLAKDILKGRWNGGCLLHPAHTLLVWKLILKTRLGTRPTR